MWKIPVYRIRSITRLARVYKFPQFVECFWLAIFRCSRLWSCSAFCLVAPFSHGAKLPRFVPFSLFHLFQQSTNLIPLLVCFRFISFNCSALSALYVGSSLCSQVSSFFCLLRFTHFSMFPSFNRVVDFDRVVSFVILCLFMNFRNKDLFHCFIFERLALSFC